ncbi:MAG TPA: AraC family transcriptional regulator [Planctomycetota bacterium]|jgi:AraC-like DNA-binding protein
MSANDRGFFRYLPVGKADQDWGIFVPDAGHTKIRQHTPYPPSQHPNGYHFSWREGRILQEFQLVYVTRGGGVFESAASSPQRVKAGNLFLLFPGVWHRYAPDQHTGWDEYWIGLDGDYPRRLVAKGFFSPRNPVLDPGHDESLLALFTQAIELIRDESPGYQQLAGALAMQILAQVFARTRVRAANNPQADPIIRKTKCYLMENLDRNLSMEQVARELHVGYSWLRHTFRRYTGLSPAQYHLQLRIKWASHLLSNSASSIKEISARLGFESPYYFSRLFKKKTGLAPEVWRRRNAAKPRCEKRSWASL